MNSLSWILYFVDVTYQVRGLLIAVMIVGWILYVIWRLFVGIWSSEIFSSDEEAVAERKRKAQLLPVLPSKWYFAATIAVSLLLTLIPSKDTVYMIAASEAGEYVVNTPEAQEMLGDLKNILKMQLRKLEAEAGQ